MGSPPVIRTAVFALGIVFSVAIGPASAEPSATLESLDESLERVSKSVRGLEAKYLATAVMEQRYEFAARLNDGQLFYLNGDYDRAAMVLLDLVEKPTSRRHPAYRDALFYLAESLFRLRNFNAAAEFFELVFKHGTMPQRQQAVAQLLQISLATNDRETASKYLRFAEQLLAVSAAPALLYATGKYHFRTGKSGRAMALFGRVPASAPDWIRARYYVSVIHTQQGRLEKAIEAFESVLATPPLTEVLTWDEGSVRNHARLGIARIRYEQGKMNRALEAYNTVERVSPLFDAAMYESVWIAIKQRAYERAMRKLEILIISQTDVIKGYDSRLLQGRLLNMVGRFDEASGAFGQVLSEFEPIQTEMKGISQDGDLVRHFNAVIGENIVDFDLRSFLPAKAAEFAGPDAAANRALVLVGDMAAQRRDVSEAENIIARLNAAVGSESRVEMFPKLHEGQLKALECRATLTDLRAQLNERAGNRLASRPADYLALRRARQSLGRKYATVPKSAFELRARDARVDDQMASLDRDAFKLGLELRAIDAQLVAIRKFARESGRPNRDTIVDQVRREMQVTEAARAQLKGVFQAIEAERLTVGVNDYASRTDDRIRRRFMQAVAAEGEWLAQHGSGVPAHYTARLDALDRTAEVFVGKVHRLVEGRVDEIIGKLQREKSNVRGYDRQLKGHQSETEALGGAIAARSFQQVLDQIEAIVLEADVGLLDVAWKQKVDKSNRIGEVISRQSTEYSVLQKTYEEVSRD
jgi:tetratricopeptide (TPR) repeat protein